MKKYLLILTVVCGVVGCERSDRVYDDGRCNTVIADFLYGVEYKDYDFNACKTYFDSLYIPMNAGCSEVRRGDFVGRNLDWYINQNASAIIKMNHTNDHYASIGVVGCFPQFSNDVAKSGEWNEVYRYLPFKTEDGVNECGLYVGVNVMPTGETSFDINTWKSGEYGHSAAHTNPSASMTCVVNYLPRILLDKAGSVEEAKKIIDQIDWVDPNDYPHKGQSQAFHWLICDEHRSVVLEFIDNKAHYTEAESIIDPGFGTIMTNFTNCLWEAGIMQAHGIGYERYDVLNNNYKDYTNYPNTFEGMQKLMEQVWFSKTFTTPIDSKDFWLTEYANDGLPADWLYKNFDAVKDPENRAALIASQEGFKNKVGWYTDDCEFWFSTHTSVYDIVNRKMHILVHEGMDGMKEYGEVSMETGFQRPLEVGSGK